MADVVFNLNNYVSLLLIFRAKNILEADFMIQHIVIQLFISQPYQIPS